MTRILDPQRIEDKSFEIIDKLLLRWKLSPEEKKIARRVIHATADLAYAEELLFHPEAIPSGLKALREGKNIVVDVNMVRAGINKKILKPFGGEVICLLNDREVIQQSLRLKVTRAILAIRKSVQFINGSVVAIGNAPTALFELNNLVRAGKARPALIVGVPVGFVGAAQAKRELRDISIPYITNRGRKGGSSVAVAIINALLKIAEGD